LESYLEEGREEGREGGREGGREEGRGGEIRGREGGGVEMIALFLSLSLDLSRSLTLRRRVKATLRGLEPNAGLATCVI